MMSPLFVTHSGPTSLMNVLNSSSMLSWYLSAGSFYLMFDIYHFTFAVTHLINSFIQNKKILIS